MDKNSVGRGLEVDVGSRYDSLLFANTMKMLGTMDDKLKNHLIFRLCHAKGYRKKKNERELIIKETVGKFIEKHAQDFTNEGKEKYKELYFETLKNLGIGFSGKNGLIAKLPLEERDKEKLDKLYSELSKCTHPSHRILKPFYEVDPGLIFTFGFEQKLFNDCFKFLGKVMDLSYAVLYIHFERLREAQSNFLVI